MTQDIHGDQARTTQIHTEAKEAIGAALKAADTKAAYDPRLHDRAGNLLIDAILADPNVSPAFKATLRQRRGNAIDAIDSLIIAAGTVRGVLSQNLEAPVPGLRTDLLRFWQRVDDALQAYFAAGCGSGLPENRVQAPEGRVRGASVLPNAFGIKRTGSVHAGHTYEVTRKDPSVAWLSNDELLLACDSGWQAVLSGRPAKHFGGRVEKHGETAFVVVYID